MSRGIWEFDGAQWNLITTEGPSACSTFNRVFVWETHRGVAVLQGGIVDASTWYGDTWEWDGVQGTKVNVPGPSLRGLHAMAKRCQTTQGGALWRLPGLLPLRPEGPQGFPATRDFCSKVFVLSKHPGTRHNFLMPPKDDAAHPPLAGDGAFHTTHWSVVLTARAGTDTRAASALETLCRVYWYPLYAFIRRQGYNPDDAQDLTQGFFARLLEKDYLAAVHPHKGRFRSFLLTALKCFLSDERDRASARKRGGNRPPISLDAQDAEARYGMEPAHDWPPERLFDRRWAVTLLARARERLREEYVSAGTAIPADCSRPITGSAGNSLCQDHCRSHPPRARCWTRVFTCLNAGSSRITSNSARAAASLVHHFSGSVSVGRHRWSNRAQVC